MDKLFKSRIRQIQLNKLFNQLRMGLRFAAILLVVSGFSIIFGNGESSVIILDVEYIVKTPMERVYYSLFPLTVGVFIGYIGFKVMRQRREPDPPFFSIKKFRDNLHLDKTKSSKENEKSSR